MIPTMIWLLLSLACGALVWRVLRRAMRQRQYAGERLSDKTAALINLLEAVYCGAITLDCTLIGLIVLIPWLADRSVPDLGRAATLAGLLLIPTLMLGFLSLRESLVTRIRREVREEEGF